MELIIIIALVLLNGVFAMSEMALVSARKFKLENARKKGRSSARKAIELIDNPTKLLSTVQIGITLIGVLLGIYSGENMVADVSLWLQKFPYIASYAEQLSVGIILVFITYLSIVLGELFPKRLGMTFPESIALKLAKPMWVLSLLTAPFVWLLTVSNNLLVKLFNIKPTSESRVSEEEIKSLIKESAEGGEIQEIEQDIVERVFELGDRKVNTLYTHRSDIAFLSTSDSWEEVRTKINQEKHSAYPVCEGKDIDNVIGIVLLKDLFVQGIENDFQLVNYIKEPLYLNENFYTYKALELFKKKKMHYGIVIDEYGLTQGIVTMDDVVDALVGEATELDQEEYQILQRDDNTWLVDGRYSVIDFVKYFDLNLGFEINNRFTTLAGLIIHLHSALPHVGDKIRIDNLILEIVDKDGQRIDKVMVTRISE